MDAGMNLRHAAVLSLVGWYLIIPPIGRNGMVVHEAMDHWLIADQLRSRSECEQAARQIRADGFGSSLIDWAVPVGGNYVNDESEQKELANCVPFAPKPR